jgi:hypothetical protein
LELANASQRRLSRGVISIAFHPARERAAVTGRGDLAASDIAQAAERLYHDPQFRSGMSTLLDLRGARPAVTSGDVRTIVSFVSKNLEIRGRGRCAVVTGREVDYGMARIAQAHLEGVGIELMVFRELEAAEQWLDWEALREGHAPTAKPNQGPGLSQEQE